MLVIAHAASPRLTLTEIQTPGRTAVLSVSSSGRYGFAIHRDAHCVTMIDGVNGTSRVIKTEAEPTHFHTHNGEVFSITIIAMGNTTNVTITSASMNPLSPAAHCNSAQSQATMPQSATTSQNTPAICSVSSASGANQRSGPGTSFAQVGSLASGDHAAVDGQSVGSDGQIWWRLGEGVWVRSDVVNETGNCDSVAVVPMNHVVDPDLR